MKFLIDTNIFIPLELTSLDNLEAATPEVTRLAQLISKARHQLYVHPAMRTDIQKDTDEIRRKVREILLNKYLCLPNPPSISAKLESILGRAEPETNDWVDNHLLAALDADAVDYVISEDRHLHKKAVRLNLQNRVATVVEVISIVQDLFDVIPPPPPAVRAIVAHELEEADPIFDSFRRDYPYFNTWLIKCKREHRKAWVIEDRDRLAAVCIIKQEKSDLYDMGGKILKICSFKVSEDYNGLRFGELLLKTLFSYIYENKYDWIYITVFNKYANLIDLLEDFGFQEVNFSINLGEIVLTKPLSYTEVEYNSMDPLKFHIRYGPPAVKLTNVQTFVIPIQPQYSQLLFPEEEKQLSLTPGTHPFGNSLRKAYLSNAAIRKITPGANLLFYRSQDKHSIIALGVAEDTLVSTQPVEIARYVGKRTVYRFNEIEELCQRGETLAILFRQSRILRSPITLNELTKNNVLSAAPQSVLNVPEEAAKWLQTRLNE